MLAPLLLLIKRDAPFCNNDKFVFSGTACWPFNLYSTPKLRVTSAEGEYFESHIKVPYFLFDNSHSNSGKPYSIVSLGVYIIAKNKIAAKNSYVSRITLELCRNDLAEGLSVMAEGFRSVKRYRFVSSTHTFNIYENYSGSSFKYYVPINQPERNLYLDCIKDCILKSAYKNISYSIAVPFEWIENYADLQKLTEGFIESTLTKN